MNRTRHDVIQARERLWYPEPARELLLQRLHDLATDPVRHRARSIAIIGESNSGKSSIISRYLRQHPVQREAGGLIVPAISINMTHIGRVEDLSVRLLEEVQAADPGRGTHTERIKRFMKLARQMQLGLIFLDEFHDSARDSKRGMQFLQLVKGLLLENHLVVPVGIESLAEVLSRDIQINSRLNLTRGRLPRIEQPAVVKAMMVKLLGEAEVKDVAVEYVLRETRGVMGHILDLIEGTVLEHGDLELASLRAVRADLDALDLVV